MPVVDPFDLIFQTFRDGIMGIVGDVTTLIVILITIFLIMIGFDLLGDYLKDPVNAFGGIKDALAARRMNSLPQSPGLLSQDSVHLSRSDIEISPLRERELDLAVGSHDTEEDLYEELKQARRESL